MAMHAAISNLSLKHPLISLITFFTIWKTCLLVVALLAPGPGYDTSTRILFSESNDSSQLTLPNLIVFRFSNLVRWDAIYFTQIAHRGIAFEQEWAFVGWGATKLLRLISSGIQTITLEMDEN